MSSPRAEGYTHRFATYAGTWHTCSDAFNLEGFMKRCAAGELIAKGVAAGVGVLPERVREAGSHHQQRRSQPGETDGGCSQGVCAHRLHSQLE